MNISHRRRWLSSERIALRVLEELGYKVLDYRVPVKINNVDVSEVDAIIEDENGEKYAVEIKAGKIDVNGIRQAYVNARILGLKPLIIGKGFSDEGARMLAEKLGVKIIQLSDYFLVNMEELEITIKEALEETILNMLITLWNTHHLNTKYENILNILANSNDIHEFAHRLGVSINDAVNILNNLRRENIFPKHIKSFKQMRMYAILISILNKNICRDKD